jgi:glycosyltransferase involved in cell wall biosynthesis
VKILLWHGYLLGGTGSNVYTRSLARAWSELGHAVTVFCQEHHPEQYDLGGARVVRPDIGRILPVFVLDRYEGLEARRVQELSLAERRRFVEANAAALREHLPADVVFTNHIVLGGPVGAAAGVPYGVKAHGSELEFSMRGNEELCAWGRESLASALAIFAGTEHIRRVLEQVLGPGDFLERVRLVPPGVDGEGFRPETREAALARLIEEAKLDLPNPLGRNERLPDEGNPERLAVFLAGDEPTVVYFGKLIPQKGVDVLLEAMRGLEARLVVVGFGPQRRELEAAAPARTLFTGPLEHRHLTKLLALADACVVPSVFPEAFGMVAAEAAAAGCPPLVARHSGLAEVAEGLEAAYPENLRGLAAFTSGDVEELRARLGRLLGLPAAERASLRGAARAVAVERWSWAHVAATLLELAAK